MKVRKRMHKRERVCMLCYFMLCVCLSVCVCVYALLKARCPCRSPPCAWHPKHTASGRAPSFVHHIGIVCRTRQGCAVSCQLPALSHCKCHPLIYIYIPMIYAAPMHAGAARRSSHAVLPSEENLTSLTVAAAGVAAGSAHLGSSRCAAAAAAHGGGLQGAGGLVNGGAVQVGLCLLFAQSIEEGLMGPNCCTGAFTCGPNRTSLRWRFRGGGEEDGQECGPISEWRVDRSAPP